MLFFNKPPKSMRNDEKVLDFANVAITLSIAAIVISVAAFGMRNYEHNHSPIIEKRNVVVEKTDYSGKRRNRTYTINGLSIPRSVVNECENPDQTWDLLKNLQGKNLTLTLNTKEYEEIIRIQDPATGGDFHLCP